jgi:hypothetical protein
MRKCFSALSVCMLCFVVYGQINYTEIKKNYYRYDCHILQTVLKDSTIFSRKNWGRDTCHVIINDFNHYFENCTIAPLFNRQVIVINRAINPHGDTTTIFKVSRKGISMRSIFSAIHR